MAEVVDFAAFKKSQQPAKLKTMLEIVKDATDFLLGDWEKMAKNNRLNDYFKSSVPNLVEGKDSKINFMSDLNEVAMLELNLELFPIIFFPGTMAKNQHGWVVKFAMGGELCSTPELASEAYARCFNILLFLKSKRDALELGLIK